MCDRRRESEPHTGRHRLRTESSLLTFELQRDQVQLELPVLGLGGRRGSVLESGRRGKGEGEEGGERRRKREERGRERGVGSRGSGERGCNLLPESRTALQIPVLRHAGRMQVRKGTDSAAANPNLGTARGAQPSLRLRGRTAAAVSGGGFVTNDLAQSC